MALHVQQQQQQIHVCDSGGDGVVSNSSLNHLPRPILVTLDLFQPKPISSLIELEEPCLLPCDWQKFLNLKTGEIYYTNMSRRNPKLDLRLNLSPPRVNPLVEQPNPSVTTSTSPTSPTISCVSSELNNSDHSNSPEATSMVLVGCPRCLMYVMLSGEDPKCPKCKSTVLLDFLNPNHNNSSSSNNNNKGKKTRKN